MGHLIYFFDVFICFHFIELLGFLSLSLLYLPFFFQLLLHFSFSLPPMVSLLFHWNHLSLHIGSVSFSVSVYIFKNFSAGCDFFLDIYFHMENNAVYIIFIFQLSAPKVMEADVLWLGTFFAANNGADFCKCQVV